LHHWSNAMLKDIVEVRPVGDYRLFIRFEDGVVDVATMVRFDGVFAPLRNREEFVKVAVNSEIGTICWPNGADLDPDVLYASVAGEAIPSFEGIEYIPAITENTPLL
jgi:hypothetical protein